MDFRGLPATPTHDICPNCTEYVSIADMATHACDADWLEKTIKKEWNRMDYHEGIPSRGGIDEMAEHISVMEIAETDIYSEIPTPISNDEAASAASSEDGRDKDLLRQLDVSNGLAGLSIHEASEQMADGRTCPFCLAIFRAAGSGCHSTGQCLLKFCGAALPPRLLHHQRPVAVTLVQHIRMPTPTPIHGRIETRFLRLALPHHTKAKIDARGLEKTKGVQRWVPHSPQTTKSTTENYQSTKKLHKCRSSKLKNTVREWLMQVCFSC